MVGLSAFEASLESTLAEGSSVAAAAGSPDDVLTAWPGAPFQLLVLADPYVLPDHIELFDDFRRAELLDFLSLEPLLAVCLHAWQLHCIARLNVDPQVV